MRKRAKSFLTSLTNEDVLMIVLAFMSFSIGIWSNYRQLWMESIGFSITKISRVLSIALICSAVIAFILSLFSTKISIKNLILESIVLRSISFVLLLTTKDEFLIKTCMLLSIMCEVIFSISYYPLLTKVNKSDETFRKKTLIDYIAKDVSIISCGLLIGVVVGKRVFDYNSCLFVSLITGLLSGIFLLLLNNKDLKNNERQPKLIESFKNIFSSKRNNLFLISQLVVYITSGILFDLMMLILTKYINFSVSFSSIFIIVCNLLGSVACSIFNKHCKNISTTTSALIKFGTRIVIFIIAFITNNINLYIISIVLSYISSRILDDKLTGKFINKIDNKDQFLFGNMRYFELSLGEGIGAYLAGILLNKSLGYIFLGASISMFIQIILIVLADKSKN